MTAPLDSAAAGQWQLFPAGDSCLILKFGEVLSNQANRLVAQCARQLNDAVMKQELVGVTDIVPAMISVGVHYRPERVHCQADESPFDALKAQLEALLRKASTSQMYEPRLIEIPVCYGGDYGPDLDEVAASLKLTAQAVIELHSGQLLDVLMLGFAPGHPYIGVLDEQLNPQRRTTPRTKVAAGSIGLANRQSVIYPLELPGGWNLIGRTPLTMFDVCRGEPCLLQSGDKIRFVPIAPATFESIQTQERQR
ncbi:5-oxoprolinase subunit PxpB [Pseudomonas sp. 21LCFQ02]|uniref:5-oxoprolinase subunit PxpB n=1 Tax=Pseudomonas sp. 21LCFQ02 TaxID=2957505 RepID=UPI00209B90DD|nr:5-oxoprolinase subunit PxpB [Pseudomonas sp. 21LCFQ02]MCO8169372.1 5-oxoprolinase subunit PxpB [Pseudomonas sp. 21LCFQ02]